MDLRRRGLSLIRLYSSSPLLVLLFSLLLLLLLAHLRVLETHYEDVRDVVVREYSSMSRSSSSVRDYGGEGSVRGGVGVVRKRLCCARCASRNYIYI